MRRLTMRMVGVGALVASALVVSTTASAEPPAGTPADDVIAYWTPERVAAAQPRDLVIDGRGLGYLRGVDGSLTPYGHSVRAQIVAESTPNAASPKGKPAPGDSVPPSVTNMDPAGGATIGGSYTFSADVTDASGIKSVSFVIIYPSGLTQSFSPGASGDTYSINFSGFSDGDWGWYVVAKDNGDKGGNTTTSPTNTFTVDVAGGGTGGGGGGGSTGDVVTNSHWSAGGDIQLAAGRILFEMPQMRGKKITGWAAYVCSGTTVTDTNTGASVILTAAHCVYDDAAKVFAQNVLFIPNQDGTTGTGTDWDCTNDPIGCFSPEYGVVDVNWTTRKFPNNVEWDYAFYVVPGSSLEDQVNELSIGFTSSPSADAAGDVTHALGYSYSDDPNFMYCMEAREIESNGVDYWMPNCDLSGGSSGGPWVAPMDEATGAGPIISVNSWGYTTAPGMAGPFLDGSAECVFAAANVDGAALTEDRGIVVTGCLD